MKWNKTKWNKITKTKINEWNETKLLKKGNSLQQLGANRKKAYLSALCTQVSLTSTLVSLNIAQVSVSFCSFFLFCFVSVVSGFSTCHQRVVYPCCNMRQAGEHSMALITTESYLASPVLSNNTVLFSRMKNDGQRKSSKILTLWQKLRNQILSFLVAF